MSDIKDWLRALESRSEEIKQAEQQLHFDFAEDNMNYDSGLTISSTGIDTISLGPIGAMGSNYNYNYSDTITLTGVNNAATGSMLGSGTFQYPTINYPGNITISNTTSPGYGQILTTGTNGLTWSDLGTTDNSSLSVKGDANFEGDVKIKGKSLVESLEKIEEKLAILRPNEKLEEKWEELRELRNRYTQLENEIIEKEKMWDILKK